MIEWLSWESAKSIHAREQGGRKTLYGSRVPGINIVRNESPEPQKCQKCLRRLASIRTGKAQGGLKRIN